MDKNYVAPCGLTCCDCLFYKNEIYETAKKLKQLIKKSQIDTFFTILSKDEVYKTIADHLGESEKNLKNILNHLIKYLIS